MKDPATQPPARPWSTPPAATRSQADGTIPPLTAEERLVASEPHGITCQQCGETYPWEQYAEHLEDAHARGVSVTVRPVNRSLLGDTLDIARGLILVASDALRRRRAARRAGAPARGTTRR